MLIEIEHKLHMKHDFKTETNIFDIYRYSVIHISIANIMHSFGGTNGKMEIAADLGAFLKLVSQMIVKIYSRVIL